ncbi:MAG: hypothetical protein A2289_08700 [Deltaproteobacteria bacterium RIFOXYA12_FULL_58_15]|nr:MAG: hypothetical protein A2289_08700 [Deltaproteobacteria bacterium RIFOXYA12_FULL_58_15]
MRAALCWVLVHGALLLPAIASADVSDKLAGLKQEPSIREVQKAALRYFGLDKTEVDSMRSRAALKAVLPVLNVSGAYTDSNVDDSTTNTEFSNTEVWVQRGVAGSATNVSGSLTWDLPKLMFNGEELDVASLAGAQEQIINKITALYYQRRNIQVDMLLNPPTDTGARLSKQIELEKVTSLIDAMTGDWFTHKIRKD